MIHFFIIFSTFKLTIFTIKPAHSQKAIFFSQSIDDVPYITIKIWLCIYLTLLFHLLLRHLHLLIPSKKLYIMKASDLVIINIVNLYVFIIAIIITIITTNLFIIIRINILINWWRNHNYKGYNFHQRIYNFKYEITWNELLLC